MASSHPPVTAFWTELCTGAKRQQLWFLAMMVFGRYDAIAAELVVGAAMERDYGEKLVACCSLTDIRIHFCHHHGRSQKVDYNVIRKILELKQRSRLAARVILSLIVMS